ncbi:hypothetical protein L0F51_00275 [Afifella sp. H1R]|uniref:phage baseplate protein n=1 Tax=Afifella sp. H1R TaxID=2908841 RepID=UPI001F286D55|nr:hypothetical protein [Afifella sp. H1R]MCF1502200.1 hypothetical protein [Afifella sp. H1R]
MSVIVVNRVIGPVALDVIVREKHESELEIAQSPIEAGADITDHAFMRGKRLVLDVADGAAAVTFNALERFQASRVPFTMVSGLYVYRNMLIRRLSAERDQRHSQILNCICEMEEAIIVGTATVLVGGEGATETRGGAAEPGGKGSRRSARPSTERATDAATADRAADTVARGDSASTPVDASKGSSILYDLTH